MPNLEKILADLNIPKQLIDKSEALLKTLFGPSFEEWGGMISDSVRLRRFKNQVKIFTRAQEVLRNSKIDPKKVSLKVLAPLIEYSSYEEDENIQEKWAQLTSHILNTPTEVVFQQNCIGILSRLSSEDAKLLDELHHELKAKRNRIHDKQVLLYNEKRKNSPNATKPIPISEISLDSLVFSIHELAEIQKTSALNMKFNISNLIALGVLKWETNVEVNAEKWNDDPQDLEITVDVDISNNDLFIFTPLGDKFVAICKGAE